MVPAFSIVMAAYNRGRHIVPTIRSVLAQSFTDYELLIVGDACDDDTEAVVRPFLSDRVIWRNLETRAGNQFGPNNAGIEMARGRYIAYIGHDDIWAPDHLAALNRAFSGAADIAFAVAGCICYGPPGSGIYFVSGLFEDDSAKFEHHFPPCSFAHRRDATDRFGLWRSPRTMSRITDADFLLRAAQAGLKFVSTGTISVHKIAADFGRYLCYVRQESSEQQALLEMLSKHDFPAFIAAIVDHAQRRGTYMALRHPDYTRIPEGFFADRSARSRGLARPPLAELNGKFLLEQSDERRGMDWGDLRTMHSIHYRWSGPNPRPKMLLPVSSRRKVDLRIGIIDSSDRRVLETLTLRINGVAKPWTFHRRYDGSNRAILRCVTPLKDTDHSIIELDMTGGSPVKELLCDINGRPERLAVSRISVRPLPWHKRLWQ